MKSFTYLRGAPLLGILFFLILTTTTNNSSSAAPTIEKQITVNLPENFGGGGGNNSLKSRLMTIKWDVSAGDRVEVDGKPVLHRQLAEGQDWTLPCAPEGSKQCTQVSFQLTPNFVSPGVVVIDGKEGDDGKPMKKDPKMAAFEKEVLDWKV